MATVLARNGAYVVILTRRQEVADGIQASE
jgi:hypothetical protein